MRRRIENGVMLQYFEWYLPADATLWKKLTAKAESLAKRGVTSVWLPPAYKGQAGINDVGYGVYDTYDLGEFDQKGTVPTKYGTKEEYLACIRALQESGIDVYADIVLNHMMGADGCEEVDAVENMRGDRTQEITPVQSIKAWTEFTFPGRHGTYSDFTWDATCFSGVDWDERKEKAGIYNFEGVSWDPGVDKENVNCDYLMGADINFSNPRVRRQLATWGQWYLDTTHVDGFRLDAVKHIDSSFFGEWLGTLRRNNHKELFSVGEYWNADINVLEGYLDACGRCMSLFDVPLHFNFFAASHSFGNFDMRHIFDGTLVQRDPEKAVTFVDNHDTQTGQALESAILDWFVPHAYALILLRPQGYPCIFYGDYYGVQKFGDQGFTGEIDVMTYIRRTRLFGEQRDYFDDEDVIGWTLEGDDAHPGSGVAVVLTDRCGGEKTMLVGERHAGEVWVDALNIMQNEVTIDEDGMGTFSCADGSVSVWVKEPDDGEQLVIERLDETSESRAVRQPSGQPHA